jgi:hypothetical protein
VSLPAIDPLYEHLVALRDAADACDPRHEWRWRAVSRWLAEAFPGQGRGTDDARQEALISLVRNVRSMRAEGPLQVAKWVSTIVRNKRVDSLRARRRDPVHEALAREPRGEESLSPLELLATEDAGAPEPGALERLVTATLEQVHRALEESEPNALKRQLRRTQAQATLLRLVCDADAEAIASALEQGEPLGKDRIYKWVERGRATVELGLARWERSAHPDERDEIAPVIAALRELVQTRRADAGLARLERRRESPVERGPVERGPEERGPEERGPGEQDA